MDAINTMFEVDIVATTVNIFIILFGIVAIITIIDKFAGYIGKPIKWFKTNNQDHDMLTQAVTEIHNVADKYEKITNQTENNTKELIKLAQYLKDNTTMNESRDKEINSIVFALQKLIADKISYLCRHYMELGGIPDDEVSEFNDLYAAYKGVHGNHTIQMKYEYCIAHLPIIASKYKQLAEMERHE